MQRLDNLRIQIGHILITTLQIEERQVTNIKEILPPKVSILSNLKIVLKKVLNTYIARLKKIGIIMFALAEIKRTRGGLI